MEPTPPLPPPGEHFYRELAAAVRVDTANTARETGAWRDFQIDCTALVLLRHLGSPDLEGVLIEHATDLVLVPVEGPLEFVSIKHREPNRSGSPAWTWSALEKDSVLIDLYAKWLEHDSQHAVAFWSNAGFSGPANELHKVCALGAPISDQLLRRLAGHLGVGEARAQQFLQVLHLPEHPLPHRIDMEHVVVRILAEVLRPFRPAADVTAERCYLRLREFLRDRMNLPKDSELLRGTVAPTLTDAAELRGLLRVRRQWVSRRAILEMLLQLHDSFADPAVTAEASLPDPLFTGNGPRPNRQGHEWISVSAGVSEPQQADTESGWDQVPWSPWPGPSRARVSPSRISRQLRRFRDNGARQGSPAELPDGFPQRTEPAVADLGPALFSSDRMTRQAAIFEYLPSGYHEPRLYLVVPLYPCRYVQGSLDLYRIRCAITHLFRPPPGFENLHDKDTGAYICLVPPANDQDERHTRLPTLAVPAAQLRHPQSWWEPQFTWLDQPPAKGTFTATQTARALGHQLPYWPLGTNTKQAVLSWAPDQQPLSAMVGEHVGDLWSICKYAAHRSFQHPDTGLRALARMSYDQFRFYSGDQGRSIGYDDEERAHFGPDWIPAVLDTLRPMPSTWIGPASGREYYYDGVEWLLTTNDTPRFITEAIYKRFGDAYRSEPFVCSHSDLPSRIADFLNGCKPVLPVNGRLRHLLQHIQSEYPHQRWRLYESPSGEFAVSDTHVAWLAIADKGCAAVHHHLLPDDPHEAHLMVNISGQLGGWILTIEGAVTILPYAGVVEGGKGTTGWFYDNAAASLAALTTGTPIWPGKDPTPLSSILAKLSHYEPTRFSWDTISAASRQIAALRSADDRANVSG